MISNTYVDFEHFINMHRCDKDNITHTIFAQKGGKFNFTGATYQQFLEKYINLLKTDNVDLHFVERPNINGVTYLFIDIDYNHDGAERLYTVEHITEIIKATNEFILNIFDISYNQLTTFITEKEKPTEKTNMFKDGFHIYYPFLPMEEKHRYYVIDYLIGEMKKCKFLNNIPYKNDVDKIFDTSVIKSNGIMMIGSKKENTAPYILTHIYDHNIKELSLEAYDDIEELVHTLSNQRYDVEAKITLCDNTLETEIDTIYNLYNGGNKKKVNIIQPTYQPTHNKNTKIVNSETELAKKLCKLLSASRASDYISWRSVGYALRSIDDSLYDEYVMFSKKCMDKFNDGKITCATIWAAATDTNYYTMGTLRHWARMDNSTEYYKIVCSHNEEIFGRSETGQHVDIASVIYELYKDRFVCIDITKDKWYEFQNHRWVFIQAAHTLKELISSEVRKMMIRYCSEKMSACINDAGGFEQDMSHKKYSKLMRVIEKLGDVNFRDNVVKACASKFYNDKFQAKLDSNVFLLGCKNGIIDLKDGGFRDGVPSDYISKSVGYNWVEFKETDEIIKKIMRFFSEVHPDPEMRDYILTFMAKSLKGVPDTKLHIWTGKGSNGKSTVIDLIKHMLGDYFGVLPVTILTKKKGASNAASPELADKYGKRFLVIQEPEHNDVIFVGQMKELSGCDTIMARPLYGDPFEYVPQFTLTLICNVLPQIPSNDNGTWRRIRATQHDSVFEDELSNKPNHFLKDEELKQELPHWAQGLLWIIVTKYYPIYKNGYGGKTYKIKEPDKVKNHTKQYKVNSDVYAGFIDENIKVTNSDTDIESLNDVYINFKNWYASSYNDKPEPKKTLVAYFKTNDYNIVNNNIIGIKIIIPN